MLKFVMSALIGGTVAMSGNAAHAAGGVSCAPTIDSAAPASQQPAPAATARAQAPQTDGRVQYRSYSVAPVAPASSYYRPAQTNYGDSYQRQFDAGRKIRGN